MKVILTLILVLAVICLGAYFLGGYQTFDPSEQGRTARATLQRGMTWTQVFDITGDPRNYYPILADQMPTIGQEFSGVSLGPANRFTRDGLAARIADNSLPEGFVCDFVYSDSVAFRVTFGPAGNLVGVEDGTTMATLLQLND